MTWFLLRELINRSGVVIKMKILLAVDGSENSLRAAEYAAYLAEHIPHSKVTMVYVDTLFFSKWKIDFGAAEKVSETPQDTSHPQYVFKETVKKMLKRAQKIFQEKQIPYKIKILEHDNVAQALSEYARKKKIEHIIMGTRGLGNFSGVLMGSVSHKMLQLATCPVTLVK